MMDCQRELSEQTPHLAPALTALVLGVVGVTAVGFYARSLEVRSIHALAAGEAMIERGGKLGPVKDQGIALQQAVLEADDLLPLYGSSELVLHVPYTRPFHPTNLFREYPTGFAVFPVGKAQSTCLIMLQKLAAAGAALAGRKLALSVSPAWFFDRPMAWADGYAGNFSALHAGEFIFDTRLTPELKQDAARRMLCYPETLANRPLLKFAVESIADGSPLSLTCYEAVVPLGIMHNALLRNMDHWNVVSYLWKQPAKATSVTSRSSVRPVDWPRLHRQAEAVYRTHSNNNEFGFDNDQWDRSIQQELARQKSSRSKESFLATLATSQEWVDLELVLRELTELGAQPVLLSMPLHGRWYDHLGITRDTRTAYYQKLRETGARYHTEVVDFADHEADQLFCHDSMGHLAPSGWLRYGQVFDRFFHGRDGNP